MITSPGECLQGSVSYGFRYVNTQATYDSSTGEGGLEDGIWVRDRKSPVITPPPLTVQPRSEAGPSLRARARSGRHLTDTISSLDRVSTSKEEEDERL